MWVKGVAVRTTLQAIEGEFGKDGLARVMESLPEETRSAFAPYVIATGHYDVHHQAALHEAVRAVLGSGDVTANRRIGARAARIDFGGIYRVFVRAAGFVYLLRGVERAFRQYNSRGSVTWEVVEKGFARCRVEDVEGYNEAMWTAILGRFETLLVLAGAQRANAHIRSFSGSSATLEIDWS